MHAGTALVFLGLQAHSHGRSDATFLKFTTQCQHAWLTSGDLHQMQTVSKLASTRRLKKLFAFWNAISWLTELLTRGSFAAAPSLPKCQMSMLVPIVQSTALSKALSTSLVDVSKNLARVLLASPSMFMVPRKLVLRVLIGLYLRQFQHARL